MRSAVPFYNFRPRSLRIHGMEVMSIADYERELAIEHDSIMDSAVDQLEALSQPESDKPNVGDLLVPFGQFQIVGNNLPRRFDFSLPSTCQSWPGPHFGFHSLHHITAKPSKSKSKATAKRGPKDDGKRSTKGRKTVRRKSFKKTDCIPKESGPVISRDPPLNLITLPPEIRNYIWTLLAVRPDPIEAQLREIRACKKLTKARGKIVRRFPIEPIVATVNKQLRAEVLSIFYGANHFIFERNACRMFLEYNMLRPSLMLRWKPQGDLVNFISNLDIRFTAVPPISGMLHIIYKLNGQSDGTIQVNVIAEPISGQGKAPHGTQYCICMEKDVVTEVREWPGLFEASQKTNLVDIATMVVSIRRDKFKHLTSGKFGNLFPPKRTCDRCEKETFQIIHAGVLELL